MAAGLPIVGIGQPPLERIASVGAASKRRHGADLAENIDAYGQSQDRARGPGGARVAGWAKRVSSVVSAVLARPESSGRVGLLGFSLGGFVAAATAAQDSRIAALGVLYGGIPDAMTSEVKHLPPLIELHGDADPNVPLARGAALVRIANALGGPAEQVTYPGKAHGFDFSDTDPATSDAIGRITRFFRARLAVE